MIFSNEDSEIIQNDYEETIWSAYKIWKNHPSKKWDYSPVKRLLKNSEKLVQWIEGMAQGGLKTVSTEENMDLIE